MKILSIVIVVLIFLNIFSIIAFILEPIDEQSKWVKLTIFSFILIMASYSVYGIMVG